MNQSSALRSALAGAGTLFAASLLAAPAQAAFPGTNGQVAFERNQTPRLLSGDYNDDSDLLTVGPDGKNVAPLVADDEGGIAAHDPAASPDGTQIAYVRSGYDNDTERSYDRIHIVGIDGSDDHLAFPDDGAGSPAWSPDGKQIVYVELGQQLSRGRAQARGFFNTLWIANADGSGAPARVEIDGFGESHADNPQWSPDGNWIAFDDGNDIYVVPAAGGRPIMVTDGGGWNTYPNWAPDGSKLAYENYDRQSYSIREVAFDAGDVGSDSVIHEGGYAHRPAYSPDGKRIAWAGFLDNVAERTALASDYPAIIVAGADGSDPKELTVGQQPLNAPEWAPVLKAEPEPTPTPTPSPTPKPVTTPPAPTGAVQGETIRRCGSRRNFVIRLRPKGVKIAMARVIIRGKRIKVHQRGSRYVATVDLRTLPRKRFKVDITVWSTTGKRFHEVRRYWTCTPAR